MKNKSENTALSPTQIKTLRLSLGYTLRTFAAALGFTGQHSWKTIYRYEKGQRTPSPQVIMIMQRLKNKTV